MQRGLKGLWSVACAGHCRPEMCRILSRASDAESGILRFGLAVGLAEVVTVGSGIDRCRYWDKARV